MHAVTQGAPAPTRSFSLDVLDRLEQRSAQLESLSCLLYGGAGGGFNVLPDAHREDLLWLVADLASEVRALVGERGPR